MHFPQGFGNLVGEEQISVRHSGKGWVNSSSWATGGQTFLNHCKLIGEEAFSKEMKL